MTRQNHLLIFDGNIPSGCKLHTGLDLELSSLRRYVRRMATFISVMMAVNSSCVDMPIYVVISWMIREVLVFLT
jgi:hypothetical protein